MPSLQRVNLKEEWKRTEKEFIESKSPDVLSPSVLALLEVLPRELLPDVASVPPFVPSSDDSPESCRHSVLEEGALVSAVGSHWLDDCCQPP